MVKNLKNKLETTTNRESVEWRCWKMKWNSQSLNTFSVPRFHVSRRLWRKSFGGQRSPIKQKTPSQYHRSWHHDWNIQKLIFDATTLRIQICSKKRISPIYNPVLGWDWDHQSYAREASGFLRLVELILHRVPLNVAEVKDMKTKLGVSAFVSSKE